ncbi:hypothetical protein PR003_g4509 [Phytophthora rubi]|uniref:Secreted protein n=1 Tax=Phytophthora rubi TaxID=129364 RepID=A0A6A3N2L0_9STRA|nr:hypothetical protein PR001_g15842 [Phytophthora rubi]KAE9039757.1 hypothetical protein PR002_g5317 [Phytophthora rubi]KAE9352187.1 hypothetical protein PR003_g4509 [Phytophthora rubi]
MSRHNTRLSLCCLVNSLALCNVSKVAVNGNSDLVTSAWQKTMLTTYQDAQCSPFHRITPLTPPHGYLLKHYLRSSVQHTTVR